MYIIQAKREDAALYRRELLYIAYIYEYLVFTTDVCKTLLQKAYAICPLFKWSVR